MDLLKDLKCINTRVDLSMNELKDVVSKLPNQFLDLQNLDNERDDIFGIYGDWDDNGFFRYSEGQVIGLAILDGTLSCFIEPLHPTAQITYTEKDMLDGDNWYSLDRYSDIEYLQTAANIMECVEEYL